MARLRPPHWQEWLSVLLIVVIALLLFGCGTSRDETQHREEQGKRVQVEQTKTERNAFAPDGHPYAEITWSTRTLDETTRAEADSRIHSDTAFHAPEIAAAARVVVDAAGGATGLPWGKVVETVVGAAMLAWGTHQTVKAKSERARADEHKADADKGWEEAMANAKALPPTTALPPATTLPPIGPA